MTKQNWPDAYGRAWVDGGPDRVVLLFPGATTHRETPFDDPMRRRQDMRENWQGGAAGVQLRTSGSRRKVRAVRNDAATAGCQARFAAKVTGARVEIDRRFGLRVRDEQATLQCTALEEWRHNRESRGSRVRTIPSALDAGMLPPAVEAAFSRMAENRLSGAMMKREPDLSG